jgi:hypothetical protein
MSEGCANLSDLTEGLKKEVEKFFRTADEEFTQSVAQNVSQYVKTAIRF